MNRNYLNFIGCDCEFKESDIVIFGSPFDGTTSFRPGTRFAPNVIRNESYGLETYSPYLDKDLTDKMISDIGDLEFPFGSPKKVHDIILENTRLIVGSSKKPFMFGGEHSVSYPAIRAVFEKYPDLHVIHLDAHTDLREDYMGEKLSHASVIKRVYDMLGENKIFQFGIRSGTKEEFEFGFEHTNLNRYNLKAIDSYLEYLRDKPIYLTVDLDVFDPSVFPGTGTPEPGGISFNEFLEFIQKINGLNFVGMDAVELSPGYDNSGSSNAVACKSIREMLLLL
jgi:agmatinase